MPEPISTQVFGRFPGATLCSKNGCHAIRTARARARYLLVHSSTDAKNPVAPTSTSRRTALARSANEGNRHKFPVHARRWQFSLLYERAIINGQNASSHLLNRAVSSEDAPRLIRAMSAISWQKIWARSQQVSMTEQTVQVCKKGSSGDIIAKEEDW